MSGLKNPSRFVRLPIAAQLVALLLGVLVVAQCATLLLTLIFPPQPPPQHSLDDIARALRGESVVSDGSRALIRTYADAAPRPIGPGWLTAESAQSRLAELLDASPSDVRLMFYIPIPAGGETPSPYKINRPAPPPPAERAEPSAQAGAADPLLAQVLYVEPQSGPPPGGGGGFPQGGPGSGVPSDFRPPSPPSTYRGEPRSAVVNAAPAPKASASGTEAAAIVRAQPSTAAGAPSPAVAPTGTPAVQDASAPTPAPGPARAGTADEPSSGPAASSGVGASPFAPIAGAGVRFPAGEGRGERQGEAVALRESRQAARVDAPASGAPREIARPVAAPASAGAAVPEPEQPEEVRPSAFQPPSPRDMPTTEIAPPPVRRGLFDSRPPGYVEGDFVAALKIAPARWVVVEPEPERFPNAWQSRIMLWFLIAFALVAPLGWMFARRLTAPLRRFADAAERLGRDPTAPATLCDGPAEIGRVASAFNLMQDRLRRYVEDRTAMIGAISHDLRTPLARMRFRLERAPEAIRPGFETDIDQMDAMIGSVLAFMRDRGENPARQRVDLRSILEVAVDDAVSGGGEVELEPGEPAEVEVDLLGVQRVFANLIDNALKYGRRAVVRLRLEGADAVAEVQDFGPGIPEQELESVFRPFYRSEAARVGKAAGFGLGLATARSVVRAHGGDVRLRSTGGLTAEVRLPLAVSGELVKKSVAEA